MDLFFEKVMSVVMTSKIVGENRKYMTMQL
jgi:hypothetical protein